MSERRSPDLCLETERLVLRLPEPEEAARVLEFHRVNREFFAPWSPPAPRGFLTEEHWRHVLRVNRQDYAHDRSLRLFLLTRAEARSDEQVVGTASFTGFTRGPFQACRLGYKLGQRWEGQGLMFEGLTRALSHVFESMGLHRVEANYMPHNARSRRLLQRLGFRVEGYARDYLYIDDGWRDHVLTSKTNPRALRPSY